MFSIYITSSYKNTEQKHSKPASLRTPIVGIHQIKPAWPTLTQNVFPHSLENKELNLRLFFLSIFVFSVSKKGKYILRLYKEHAPQHMVYFHSSFLNNYCSGSVLGCIVLRSQSSGESQHRGKKICACHLWETGKCPRRNSSSHIFCDQEQEEVKLHPALPSSTKEQNCTTFASLPIPTTQRSRKECWLRSSYREPTRKTAHERTKTCMFSTILNRCYLWC